MNKQQDYLTSALCVVCKKSLPSTGDYIKCQHCGNRFHYSPCATLSESTYNGMTNDRKAAWKCHICRGERIRSKSPNNLYQEITHDEATDNSIQQNQRNDQHQQQQQQHNKQQKEIAEIDNASNYINTVNTNVSDLKSDLLSFKSCVTNDLSDIKSSIQQVNNNIISVNNSLKEEMANSYKKLTEAISSIALQVSDLIKENKEKDFRLLQMENKVNYLEQKIISKNIEIKNVNDDNMTAVDIIKTIALSVNVEVKETDLCNAYKIQKHDKVIVEFNSLSKKKELLSNIHGHKINGNILKNPLNKPSESNNNDNSNFYTNTNNKPIYINEQLTSANRRLLWLAKTKAKDFGWKFVWVRDGHIYAKKNENATSIKILNICDIELIAN